MILARLVDVGTLGEILYATVFSNIAVVLASYGFENLTIREVSQEHYSIHEITLNLVLAKLILSGILVLAVVSFIDLVPIPLRHPGDLWFYFGASLINSFINSLNALRKGKNDFATEMKVSLFGSSLLFVGTLIAVFTFDATTLLVGQVRLLSRVIALFFAVIIFLKRLWREKCGAYSWGPKLATVWELFVAGFPFGLQAILGTAYFQLDVLVLGALKTSVEVGFYQAPMQLITAVMLVPIAVIQAYYPRLARAFWGPDSEGLPLMRQMMRVLAVLGLGFTVLFGIGASVLITVVYGAKMGPSIPAMRILSLVFIVRSMAGGLGMSLMAVGLQKVPALAGFIALIGSLGLNLLLIPKGGFIAVAWVNLTTNFGILCLYTLWWKRTMSFKLPAVPETSS
jgi:O-antigen/teichoic acid export membrane protein